MINLDKYGAACRCLLRIRENGGAPHMSDAAFVARFTSRYQDWHERPGATDIVRIGEVAHELGLADRVDVYRDYDYVLRHHRDGCEILIGTDRVPEQRDGAAAPGRHVLLLVAMDEAAFALWCPYPNGHSEILPKAQRVWWDRWQAIGVVLHAPAEPRADTGSAPQANSPTV